MQVPSALLPLLRSAFQGELLAWLYLHPDNEFSATELAHRFHVSQATASREADRLTRADLITERKTGNLRLLKANLTTAVARPLVDLLAVTYGPIAVLSDLLASAAGLQEAYIYGSWAARYSGESGPVPNDVDVFVVGETDEDQLFDIARHAERRLGREVNIRRISPDRWVQPNSDPFIESVRSRPLVRLDLNRSEQL